MQKKGKDVPSRSLDLKLTGTGVGAEKHALGPTALFGPAQSLAQKAKSPEHLEEPVSRCLGASA